MNMNSYIFRYLNVDVDFSILTLIIFINIFMLKIISLLRNYDTIDKLNQYFMKLISNLIVCKYVI